MRIADKLMQFKTLYDMLSVLGTDEACREYFERSRWGDSPTCPYCGCQNHYKLKRGGEFRGLYKCVGCKKRYTVAIGTMFESSHVPYRKWFLAIYVLQSHKKGISSKQLASDIGVTERTAWFMLHRIRHSMGEDVKPQLEGRIQLDETFVGGKNKSRHHDKKVEQSQGRSFKDKTPVMGMLQQAEKEIIFRPHKTIPFVMVKETIVHKDAFVRCQVVPDTKGSTLKPIIREHVVAGSVLISDEWQAYQGLSSQYDHRVVDHRAKQYVNEMGDTSNALEGFWTWVKRSYIGIYHNMSRKHLQLYVDESAFRYNTCRMKQKERFDLVLKRCDKPRITYKQLISRKAA